MKVILASSSRRRYQLLNRVGIRPRVFHPTVREERLPGERVESFVQRISREKALEIYRPEMEEDLVIGSDTIVYLDGNIIGKPRTRKEARDILVRLSGNSHQVWTGVYIKKGKEELSRLARTRVSFDQLSPDQIAFYLDHERYMDKAGAYGIQGLAALFINRIEGCYFNVMGFPLNLFFRMLGQMGVSLGDICGVEANKR